MHYAYVSYTLLQQYITALSWTRKGHSLFRCATDCKHIRKLKAVLIQKPLLPSERSISACCITIAIRRRWLARMSIHVCGLLHKFPWPLLSRNHIQVTAAIAYSSGSCPLEGLDVNNVDRTLGLNNTEFVCKSTYFVHVWIIFPIKAVRCFYFSITDPILTVYSADPWLNKHVIHSFNRINATRTSESNREIGLLFTRMLLIGLQLVIVIRMRS
jgi:hypothetical protein